MLPYFKEVTSALVDYYNLSGANESSRFEIKNPLFLQPGEGDRVKPQG
jgi:hypothetical protein